MAQDITTVLIDLNTYWKDSSACVCTTHKHVNNDMVSKLTRKGNTVGRPRKLSMYSTHPPQEEPIHSTLTWLVTSETCEQTSYPTKPHSCRNPWVQVQTTNTQNAGAWSMPTSLAHNTQSQPKLAQTAGPTVRNNLHNRLYITGETERTSSWLPMLLSKVQTLLSIEREDKFKSQTPLSECEANTGQQGHRDLQQIVNVGNQLVVSTVNCHSCAALVDTFSAL